MLNKRIEKPLQDDFVRNEDMELVENTAENTFAKYKEAANWCNANNAHIEDMGDCYVVVENAAVEITTADYDNAMEEHLKAEQTARGYTTRSPNEYANSTNARWKQDAADWSAHVTAVMEYALEIENKHAAGEAVPTLDEFKAALPKITWTYSEG